MFARVGDSEIKCISIDYLIDYSVVHEIVINMLELLNYLKVPMFTILSLCAMVRHKITMTNARATIRVLDLAYFELRPRSTNQ
jgi:hypothetical protein